MSRVISSFAVSCLAALVGTAWVLGRWPVLGRSQVILFRDDVAVPDPVRPVRWAHGDPVALRAWPLDGVTWLLSPVVPPGTQQLLLVAVALVLAGTGTGVLAHRLASALAGVPAHGAAIASALLATLNPYTVERLLLGQAPTLLGYAVIPWVVVAARHGGAGWRRVAWVVLAMAPAAITPWGGVVAAVVAVVALWLPRPVPAAGRTSAVVAAAGVALWLPWLVPALTSAAARGGADPDGAAAFAARDDTGLGLLFSTLTGGGVWSAAATPESRGETLSILAAVVVMVLAVVGVAVLARHHRRWSIVAGTVWLVPAVLVSLASGPLLPVMTATQRLPGVAMFRDTHRSLAPGVVVGAVLAGLALAWCAARLLPAPSPSDGFGPRRTPLGRPETITRRVLVSVVAGSLAVTAVPDGRALIRDGYRPAEFPAEFTEVQRALDDPHGVVMSLPWQPLRRTDWAHGAQFLDPTPRAVRAAVLVDDALVVRRSGREFVVTDHPLSADWTAALRRGEIPTDLAEARGVTQVLVWRGSPGAPTSPPPGWAVSWRGEHFELWGRS